MSVPGELAKDSLTGPDPVVPASVDEGMHWPILISCCLASAAVLLQPPLWVFNPPSVQPFDAAWANFRLLASLSGILQIFFVLIGGVIGDLTGRRRLWLIGLSGFVVSNLLLMLTLNPSGHVAMRILALAFGSLVMPFALATINATYKGENRPKAFAIYVIINAGAVQLAWLQGQFLFGWIGWRATYLLPMIFGLWAMTWIRREIAEAQAGQHRRLDILVQSGWTLLVLAVVFGLTVLPVADEFWILVVGAALLVGLIGAILVFWWNRHTPGEVLRNRSYRVRDLTALIITGAVISFTLFGFGLRTIGLFQVVRSMSAVVAVIALAPVLFGSIAALYLFLRAMRKYQARAVIAGGMLIMAVALAGAALVPADGPYLLFAVPLFIFGAGYLVTSTVWTSAFLRTTVARYYGVTAAITSATSLIGGAIGSAVTSRLLAELGLELYSARMVEASVDVIEGIAALVGFKTLVLSEPGEVAAVADHLGTDLMAQYREVYAIAYSQILWLMVAFCAVTAVIIALGLRSSLRAHIRPPTDEELGAA